ncbi:uncharacterized protein LOC126828661 [Patella vulgata]|uniref:uncharacterized protein LOC126828661 n=1 Tax=Patella vulgata TaxID=6465 RepID=UPI00217FF9DF|nr:uncharacterized protein LOC126828661 [Patella vulgata]XP_050414526.1 uncharacterized protein LOC126828661 [Patella vulgata]XP_050414527.1 uncharacterized protein LOC126828661 [Patella vulgata]XP_050414528.1 uncharacterized protein LOC126828661 [Patella vulgata]XP_050414529.1 uncharacterized protein LOC126828661 [Patella vulgata]
MMTQISPEPRPLTRTNVTRHDKIWEKEDPCNFFGFNTKDSAFSPPLKHITPDTAKELWENFDPLDVLDSGSDSSCDTMIMMNTAEELRNEESIQRSNQTYEQCKIQHENSYNYGLKNLGPSEEDDVTIDEGYGTDNRTNTSTSLSSPLSSSLSSLSTLESTSSQGSINRLNPQMSRTQQNTSSGRPAPNTRPIMPVRRVTKPVDNHDTSGQSLEERLRALTTIEEEEPSGSDQERPGRSRRSSESIQNRGNYYENQDVRNANRPVENTYQNRGSYYENEDIRNANYPSETRHDSYNRGSLKNSGQSVNSDQHGIFHAVPVQVGSQNRKIPEESDYITPTSPTSRQEWINRVEKMGYVPHSDVKYYDTLWNDKNIQMGMSDKFGDGKRIPSLDNDIDNDLIIKQKQRPDNHMVSMPDLRFDRQSHPAAIYSKDSAVKLRPKPPAKRDRYSWGYGSIAQPVELANHMNPSDRLSDRGTESPRLQDQLRAMSELSLGIKKPLYASSADIYKLFQGQGQGQYGLPQGRNASHRHSFHAMPSSQTWLQPPSQSSEEVKMRLRSASTSSKVPSAPPKPMRVNYGQLNQSVTYQRADNSVHEPPSLVNGGRSVNDNPALKSKLSTLV